MATADEILAAEVGECDDILTVDLDSRIIIVPENVTNIGVESDDKTKKLHFRVPRYYCDIDLSTFAIRINYLNASEVGDVYDVMTSEVTDDMIRFDWEVGRNAVSLRGNVTFIVCLKDVDAEGTVIREFNTTLATLPVLPGLETGEAAIQEHTDIFEQWRTALFNDNEEGMSNIKEATNEALSSIDHAIDTYMSENYEDFVGPQGENGATFTPDLDEEGNISWTNNKGLENPTTRNITGPKGDTGDAFTYDMFTEEQLKALTGPKGENGATFAPNVDVNGNISWSNDKDLENPATRNIKGPKGETGATFTPDLDEEGNISWTNDKGLDNPSTRNIKGPKGETGDAFTYDMFTEEQLENLTGPKGDAGEAFTYDMFTEEQLENLTGPKGETGATFTPEVDDEGNISWSNDKGLSNPVTRNIKGPKGDTGDAFTYGMFTTEQLEALTGPKGDPGTYIVSIERTSGIGAAGTVDTYTLTTNDGTTFTFNVYNGADGEGAGDMLKSIYDPQGKNTDIFAYVDEMIGGSLSVIDAERFENLIEQGG